MSILQARKSLLIPAESAGDLASEILSDSPSWYYRLSETSGSVAVNATGGASGTYGAAVTLNQTPLYSGGPVCPLFSNVSNSYVDIPASLMTSATALSLVAIIKPSTVTSGVRAIICRDPFINRVFQWRLNNGDLEFVKIIGGVATVTRTSVMTASEIAIVGITISTTGSVNMYKNGSVIGSPTSIAAANYGHASTNFSIGYQGGPAAGFSGNESECAAFASELSAGRMLVYAQASGFA